MLGEEIVSMDVDVNYPELGTVSEQRIFYREGDLFLHPSGVTYIRQNGNWEVYVQE